MKIAEKILEKMQIFNESCNFCQRCGGKYAIIIYTGYIMDSGARSPARMEIFNNWIEKLYYKIVKF